MNGWGTKRHDNNGLFFVPECTCQCFANDEECNHDNIQVDLNKLGDYVAFPSLWYHHGYYNLL